MTYLALVQIAPISDWNDDHPNDGVFSEGRCKGRTETVRSLWDRFAFGAKLGSMGSDKLNLAD